MRDRLSYPGILTIIILLAVAGCNQTSDDSRTYGPAFNENIRPTEPRTPEEELAGFILPPGFEIELYASEPQIDKPMNLNFDAQGRLWVTQSFEYPFPTIGSKGTDKLTIIEDTDQDGKADQFSVVKDTLNIPIGVLPFNDGALVFSVPNLYRFYDEAHDDHMESSKRILGPFGYQDTHGMVSNLMRGYDGWVHACHGFTNRSVIAGDDGDSITLVSGNTFRFLQHGRRVEQLTFGQVNPFGLVLDEYGYTYSTDSHSSPLYQLIRGGDYPHFGKVSVMGFAPDMKSLEKEATALCGITQYADVLFPEEFQGNFFIGDVVNSRVHRYSATWNGSSPAGKSEIDFIKSEDPWFRPVNVKLGPDGALYIADFYNAIIGHYEVPLDHPKRDKQRGRIWRVTYKGERRKSPDLMSASAATLMKAMDSDNLPTRMMATDQFTDRFGPDAKDLLLEIINSTDLTPRQTVHALWALERIGALTDEKLKEALAHDNALVRVHALRIVRERPVDNSYYELITAALGDKDPHVRRAALELLPQHASEASLNAALSVLRSTDVSIDSHLYYTARLTIRNILRNQDVLTEAVKNDWNDNDSQLLAAIMVDVPFPESAKFLSDFMERGALPTERIPAAYTQIARFTPVAELSTTVDRAMERYKDNPKVQSLAYKAIVEGLNQRGGNVQLKIFDEYAPALAQKLLQLYPPADTTDVEEKYIHQRTAIDIAGDYRVTSLEPVLKTFLSEGHRIGWTMRGAALRSLMKINPANASLGADILEKDSVREYQRRIVVVMGEFPGKAINDELGSIKVIPTEAQEAVVVALAGTSEGKDIVFKKVRAGEILPRAITGPRAEERLLSNANARQQKEFAALTADLVPISEEKQKIINQRFAAFQLLNKSSLVAASGKQVFDQNCGVCHKTGGEMGVGPQLDGIGKTGARGLIEKIIDPNRNVSKAFQNYTIKLKDGSVKTGLFRRDEGQSKVYADITAKEFSVQRGDIVEETPSKYTLMPDSFAETIPEGEFHELIGYLLTL
jgi:putative heme-binding domain-containing protein